MAEMVWRDKGMRRGVILYVYLDVKNKLSIE